MEVLTCPRRYIYLKKTTTTTKIHYSILCVCVTFGWVEGGGSG
jgi:hypothetical protein